MENREKYINDLDELLIDRNVNKQDRLQILEDYRDLYDQGLEQGLSDKEVYQKLGSPREIYQMIKKDLSFEYKTNKLTGLMVFIAIIIFFVLGNGYNLWNYSWLAFLLIPITGILTTTKIKESLPGLMVFIVIAIFTIFGSLYDLYHPLWLLFLLVPISGILTGVKEKKYILVSLSPFVSLIIYILVSYFNPEFYKIGWLVFLSIPFLGCIVPPVKKENGTLALLILLSVIGYLLLLNNTGEYGYPLFIFAVPLLYSILTGNVQIEMSGFKNVKYRYVLVVILTIIITYLVVSLLTGSWDITWIILLLIPMAGIFSTQKFDHMVAYMPFLALIVFMLVIKYVPDSATWAWLIFLSVPITGILESDKATTIEVKRIRSKDEEHHYEFDEIDEDEVEEN